MSHEIEPLCEGAQMAAMPPRRPVPWRMMSFVIAAFTLGFVAGHII